MTIATTSVDEAPVGAPPTPPAPVASLALAALAISGLCAVFAGLALNSLRSLGSHTSVGLAVVLIAVGVACCLPVINAVRALASSVQRARHYKQGEMPAARRAAAEGREHATTALGWSLSVLVLAGLAAFVAANHGAVAHTFLRWDLIKQSWWPITKAFWTNIQVAVYAEVLVLVFALVVAIMRLLPGRSGRPLRWLATAYADVFRAIPGVIVLYLVGYGLALAKVPVIENLSPMWLAIVALTLTYSGYVAEVYRAGIESIHPSQWAASRSLGLSYGMTLRTVIIPQAVRRIVPPLLNDFIGLQKDTALLVIIGINEAFTTSRFMASNVFNLTPIIVVAVLFVVITIPQARFVDRLILREMRRAGRA
ncbi:MAG: amino acid ABC transporter permease [Marmoricola sp.]